jgi:hypothetical protein
VPHLNASPVLSVEAAALGVADGVVVIAVGAEAEPFGLGQVLHELRFDRVFFGFAGKDESGGGGAVIARILRGTGAICDRVRRVMIDRFLLVEGFFVDKHLQMFVGRRARHAQNNHLNDRED